MTDNSSTPPRRLLRLWWLVRDGLPSAGRYRRYIFAIAPFMLMIWGLLAAYLLLAPVSYKSSMTLILPGSGVGGSINLESIGQASSQTSSAFATPSLSPTENYKRLLGSDLVLQRGAKRLDDGGDRLPNPSVKLVDQTNLIMVAMAGPTPEQAQARLEALRQSFLASLERLRQDEAEKRETADLGRLQELEQKLQQAQRRVLEFQGEAGLATLDQFNQRLGVVDDLEGQQRSVQLDLERYKATAKRLSQLLQVSLAEARSALLLKADPIFQSLLSRYAIALTDWNQDRATLGDRHLRLTELKAQKDTLQQAMLARGATLTGLPPQTLQRFIDLSVSEGRARLFDELLGAEGTVAGLDAELAEIRHQIRRQNQEHGELVQMAAELSDRLREQRISEAVFSSALARLDTNKSDPFASYPLVQTFESPSLPNAPSSPSTVLAVAGGVVASIFVIMGFLLLWLRQPIIKLLLPKG
ncbi:hypothetical protein EVC62_09430 [Salinicola endophyticus]|uniref:Lipopolysaccharide biosynthesis protein n=1 Tax=Salinicola endophyticus TaxID=1949083 RepID=A0ABY8FFY1_9GAMM|nr:hypothetical protein [Salinicola endophyticus]WFF41703.1 hypothetical protein EVC62_09430 [Salinicola endophyticus]